MPLRDRFKKGESPLYLIDGTSYIYRGYYAFGDLTRSDGFPTNALFIVLRLALRLLREERPSHAAFVLDGRARSFRADVFPAYKAQREKMPEPLARQIDPIMGGIRLLGFPVLREEGVEADDTIASLAARFKGGRPVVVVGSDKDLRQCLDEGVVLWDPSGKQERLTTLADFLAEFPAGPAHWPDYQALMGDSSDNIPGVPGVGPKTAAEIVAKFPSLELLRQGIGELKPAWRKKIEPHLDELFVYRKLTRLKLDAAEGVALGDLAVTPASGADIARFLNSFELRSLAREAAAWAAASGGDPTGAAAPGGRAGAGAAGRGSLFGQTGTPSPQGPGRPSPLGQSAASPSPVTDRPSLPGPAAEPDAGPAEGLGASRIPLMAGASPAGAVDPMNAAGHGACDSTPSLSGEPPQPAGAAPACADSSPAGQARPPLPAAAQADPERLSLFDVPARRPAPAAAPPKPAPIEEVADLTGLEAALVPADGGFHLAATGREWFVAAQAAGLAPMLARAASVYAPSLKDLIAAYPELEAVPLDRWFDLSLAAYLLSPEERVYSWERLQDSLWADPGFSPDEAPGGSPALACLALGKRLRARCGQAGLDALLRDLELPLVPVLANMERAGIRIDKHAFAAFAAEVNGKLARLTRRMHEEAGAVFNIRSSQQLSDVLYNRLGLRAPAKTPGGAASTSAEVLERLAGKHPLVDSILEFRKLEKLRSTYLEPLPALADGEDRIHTTFNQLATATGRLSSSAPNLQNIPARGELGRRMRSLFVAAPGMALASADYSQIELRVLAHFSGDPALIEAFRQGQDIHSRTAALLFDKLPGAVSPEERRHAKTVNFGLLYGMGPQKLGRELGLTLNEAKAFIARYFERLKGLKEYYQGVVDEAKARGYVTTLAGRRRLLPDINSRNTQLEAQARRQAVNTVIQGSAADIIKMAMLGVAADETLGSLGARLILQIHDELVLEVPEAAGRAAGERMREIMSGVVSLSVPITADMGVGRDWGGAH
jgi:DNA polymerase-1